MFGKHHRKKGGCVIRKERIQITNSCPMSKHYNHGKEGHKKDGLYIEAHHNRRR